LTSHLHHISGADLSPIFYCSNRYEPVCGVTRQRSSAPYRSGYVLSGVHCRKPCRQIPFGRLVTKTGKRTAPASPPSRNPRRRLGYASRLRLGSAVPSRFRSLGETKYAANLCAKNANLCLRGSLGSCFPGPITLNFARLAPDFSPAFEAKPSRVRRVILHARLATEDPAGVSSFLIRRGGCLSRRSHREDGMERNEVPRRTRDAISVAVSESW